MPALGNLYLLPVPISDAPAADYLPALNFGVIQHLVHFIAEDAKTARRVLKLCNYPDISKAQIALLNEHSKGGDLGGLLDELLKGHDVGLMSDAGCPGIADPGADLVRLAHGKGIRVVPLVGPSAIVLGIMASGFNGQNFAFVGYLPVDKQQRLKRLKELEQLAGKGQAQFFIETPYRNEQLFDDMLTGLDGRTLVFIGKDVTSPGATLLSKPVSEWKKTPKPALHKVPVVFGIFR